MSAPARVRSPWLSTWHPEPWSAPVLLCLPPAGAGCGRFGALQPRLGPAASVVGVLLPGREQRWAESAPDTVQDVVTAVADALDDVLAPDHPVVVHGQSLGGLLGYEITRERWRRTGHWPLALVVAACRPPVMWVGAGRGMAAAPSALAELVDQRGLGADELDEDTREFVLELLAADAGMTRDYAPSATAPIGCPLEVWGGTDDPTVTAEHLAAWAPTAGAGFRHRRFVGGHYFPDDHPDLVLGLLAGLLRRGRSPEGAPS